MRTLALFILLLLAGCAYQQESFLEHPNRWMAWHDCLAGLSGYEKLACD